SDAFGFRRGDESVGIYDERSVRGFSLEAAGNYRLNGSYFVKNSGVSNFFIDSTTVRIGYNTLGSILPGPSGVVDYRLRDPAPGEASAATLTLATYGQPIIEINLRGGSSAGSYSAGIQRNFDVRNHQGGRGGEDLLIGGTGRLTRGAVTGQIFAGEYQYLRRGEFRVMAADVLPARIARGRYLGQDWAFDEGQRRIAGALVDAALGARSGVGATVAFGQEDPTRAYLQFFGEQAPDGTVRSDLVVVPQQRSTAWSGEVRGHVERTDGTLLSRVDASLRARRSTASFGGGRSLALGRVAFGEAPPMVDRPAFGGAGADQMAVVDQWGVGLTYRGEIPDRLRTNFGVLRTDYVKRFTPAGGVERRNASAPWLYNAGAAMAVAGHVELYGSYTRGLEEAGVAPAAAANRNEILDAIIVTQRELGLRWAEPGGRGAVVAAFDTRKPYAGIARGGGDYRFLGNVRHRGVETSLSGRLAPGVQAIVGGVLIDADVHFGDGSVPIRPVAVPAFRVIASLDAAVPGVAGLNLDGGVVYLGRRAARSLRGSEGEQPAVPALATFDLGARYAFSWGGRPMVLRAQLLNLTNAFAWEVNASETLSYNEPRRARLLLTTRF
ncbi:MAG: TonB-dependent receptor, partial [Sphingomonadaceae bacterium]|nr:TonB-dependent receptor [Sphingomonadaceae bacterium]